MYLVFICLVLIFICLYTISKSLAIHIHTTNLAQSRVFSDMIPAPKLEDFEGNEEALAEANDLYTMRGGTPPDCFGGKLIKFMTSLEEYLKRFSSEFLLTLCDEDTKEFTIRCG